MGQRQLSFAVRPDSIIGRQLHLNLSKALSLFVQTQAFVDLEAKYFRTSERCDTGKAGEGELERVSLKQMSGLFIMVGCLAGASVFTLPCKAALAAWWGVNRTLNSTPNLPGASKPAVASAGEASLFAAAHRPNTPIQVSCLELNLAEDPNATDGDMIRALLRQVRTQQQTQ